MSDTLILLHTAIAIIAIVLLILVVRIEPVISLVIGTIYLGLAAGLWRHNDRSGPAHRLPLGRASARYGGATETGQGAAETSRSPEAALRFQCCLEYHFPGHLRGRPTRSRGPPWPGQPLKALGGMGFPG